MRTWMLRAAAGLALALPMALFTFALAQARNASAAPAAQTGQVTYCQVCHEDVVETWGQGHHGLAASRASFNAAWESQGRPGECLPCHTTGYDPDTGDMVADGITCEACHSPVNANHPKEPMPTDRSAASCGKCHTETLFEWQVSGHRQSDLSCVGCHDPHATGLKTSTPSELCATCHRERSSNFAHTEHSLQGLTCAECHLAQLNGDAGEGHAVRDHSFNVKLSTCNACHVYQMHDPGQVHSGTPTPLPPDSLSAVETSGVSVQPDSASPFGFAALAGILGLGIGIVMAPWLERWYRRLSRDGE